MHSVYSVFTKEEYVLRPHENTDGDNEVNFYTYQTLNKHILATSFPKERGERPRLRIRGIDPVSTMNHNIIKFNYDWAYLMYYRYIFNLMSKYKLESLNFFDIEFVVVNLNFQESIKVGVSKRIWYKLKRFAYIFENIKEEDISNKQYKLFLEEVRGLHVKIESISNELNYTELKEYIKDNKFVTSLGRDGIIYQSEIDKN